jgi:hypothetical protein
MNKQFISAVFVGISLTVLPLNAAAPGNDESRTFGATLSGFEEPPAIASSASGEFSATLNPDGSSFDYTLTYEGFTTDVFMSHIHFGLPSVNGGVTVWLCGSAPPSVPPTPACPARSGSVSGTITADNVLGIQGQRLVARDFAKLLEAIEFGATYVNVHSRDLPGGEIRGQLKAKDRD